MQNPWYKNAVIYGLDVAIFQDSNGDGIGDFSGLMNRLSYLKNLGITCLWLLPFYPTPNRDNGYDITNYLDIDPRLGTLDDFRDCMREAKRIGLRVVIDLVVQHTSDQHPWFKAAETNPDSPYRKYYIWSKKSVKSYRANIVFPGEEKDILWSYSKSAKLWYHHWFYSFQPELDIAHSAVKEEIFKIAKFWMSLGISGFRLDAAGLLFSRKGMPGYTPGSPGPFLRDLRNIIRSFDKEGVLFGEADVKSRELRLYFGKGDRINVLYNFILNQYLTLAVASKNALPIINSLKTLPKTPGNFVWINFIRNLDEYNLEKLRLEDITLIKKEMHVRKNMWIYGRGIRRRIAPLINDTERLKMMWSLMFSLPGSPMIIYGDEIGMGDNLALPFRKSVRTPMQWNDSTNGGFSRAPKSKLVLPVVDKGVFSYKKVNVAAEVREPKSLLVFIKKLIAVRKRFPEVGSSKLKILKNLSPQVVGFQYSDKKKVVTIVHNLSEKPITVKLPEARTYKLVFSTEARKKKGDIHLGAYGHAWLRGEEK